MSGTEASSAALLADLRQQQPDLVERIETAARLAERQRIREVFTEADGFDGDVRPYLKAVWPVAFDTGGTAGQAAQAVLKVRRPAVQATEKLKASLQAMTPAQALEARLREEREEAFAAGVAAELRRAAKTKQEQRRAKKQRQAQRRKGADSTHQPAQLAGNDKGTST